MFVTKTKIDPMAYFLAPYFFLINVPWLYYRFGSRLGIVFFVLWLSSTVRKINNKYTQKAKLLGMAFIVCFAGNYLLQWIYPSFDYGSWPKLGSLANYGSILTYFVVLYVYAQRKDYATLRFLCFVLIATFLLSGAINIVGLQKFEFGSRDLTASNYRLGEEYAELVTAGIARFDFVYGMALSAPVILFAALKARRWSRAILLVTYFVLATCVLMASYFIGVIAFLLGSALALANYQRALPARMATVLTIIPILLFFISPGLLESILDVFVFILNATDNSQYILKINEVSTVISNGFFSEGGPLGNRISLYLLSWNGFLMHPLFGNGNYTYPDERSQAGGHSTLFDLLADMGVFGLIVAITMFWVYRKYVRLAFAENVAEIDKVLRIFLLPAIFVCFLNPCKGPPVWGMYFFLTPALVTMFKDLVVVENNRRMARPYEWR